MMSEDKIIDFLVAETLSHKSSHQQTTEQAQRPGRFDLMSQLNRLELEMFFGHQEARGFVRFKINALNFDLPEAWLRLSAEGYFLAHEHNDPHSLIQILSQYLGKNADSLLIGKTGSEYLLLLWNRKEHQQIQAKVLEEFSRINKRAA